MERPRASSRSLRTSLTIHDDDDDDDDDDDGHLMKKVTRSFETSTATYSTTQRDISGQWDP